MTILALVILSVFDLAARAQRVLDLHRRRGDAPVTFSCCRVLGWGFVVVSEDRFFQDLLEGIERRHGTHLPGVRHIPPESRTGQALTRYLTWRGLLAEGQRPCDLHVLHPRVAERVLYAADCEIRLNAHEVRS